MEIDKYCQEHFTTRLLRLIYHSMDETDPRNASPQGLSDKNRGPVYKWFDEPVTEILRKLFLL